MSRDIRINGQPEPLFAETMADLLRARGIAPGMRGVAVALNGAVVPAGRWPETRLNAGDTVEIVRPFAGG